MSKVRVPIFQQPRNFRDIDPEATEGATIGVNLYNADGSLFDFSQLNPATTTTVINGVAYSHVKDATSARAITAADDKKIIEFTGSGAIAITVSGLIPFSAGFDCVVFCSASGAQATFSGTNGMTITSSDSLKTRTRYSPVGFMVEDTNQAILYGDIEPVAPAASVLVRAANSVGAPDWLASAVNGEVLTRVAGVIQWAVPAGVTPLDTTLSYIGDKLDVVTTAAGTKTMGYTGDKLTSIVGTGIYPSKNFTYTGDLLTGIDVL